MRSVAWWLLFLVVTLAVSGQTLPAAQRAMTVVLDPSREGVLPLDATRRELQRIVGPLGFMVDFRLKKDLPAYPQFGEVAVFKLKGRCDGAGLPGFFSQQSRVLGVTYMANGEALPFGEVDCGAIREALSKSSARSNDPELDFATALARVLAHEIYHMTANSVRHTRRGITKESLSAAELCTGEAAIPAEAQERIWSIGGRGLR